VKQTDTGDSIMTVRAMYVRRAVKHDSTPYSLLHIMLRLFSTFYSFYCSPVTTSRGDEDRQIISWTCRPGTECSALCWCTAGACGCETSYPSSTSTSSTCGASETAPRSCRHRRRTTTGQLVDCATFLGTPIEQQASTLTVNYLIFIDTRVSALNELESIKLSHCSY